MKRWWMLGLGVTLLAAACGGAEVGPSTVPPETIAPISESASGDALSAARGRWSTAPADYVVTVRNACPGCSAEPQTLAVREGEAVSLARADESTIDDVFETIETSIDEGANVDVEYDVEFGYPTRVVIDRDDDGEPEVDLHFEDLEAMPIVRSLEEIVAAKELWDAQGLDAYRFIFRADCTCPDGGTFEVSVSGGTADFVPLDEAAEVSELWPGDLDDAFRDLEAWFTASEEFIDDGLLDVDVRMDPRLGYPRWFRIEGANIDDGNFAGPFTLIVTVDLVDAPDPLPVPATDPDPDAVALDIAVEQWGRTTIADYRFVWTRYCECDATFGGPFDVEVVERTLSRVTRQDDGSIVDQSEIEPVSQAFTSIRAAIDAGIDVDVTYHDILGYPLLVIIDPEAAAVDGGFVYEISDLAPTGGVGIVAGKVAAGPQCPVQTDPPKPGCEDQPVPEAPLLIDDGVGDDRIVVPVAADGSFVALLAPGNYVVEAQPVDGLLGTPGPIDVTVTQGGIHVVDVTYDTGIR